MSYQRIVTPRVYVSSVNWLLGLGKMATTDITSSGLSMASGSTLIDMFDLRPSNVQTITANGVGTTHYIKMDTNVETDANQDANFLLIMGHNFNTATAKFKIETDDNDSYSSVSTPTMTEVVNATITGGYAVPAADGWSLVTFTQATDNKNVRIVFDDRGSNYGAHIQLSVISLGEHFTFPHSPDMQIEKSLTFEGVKLIESIGGNTYSNASYLASPQWNTSPFFTADNAVRKTGRLNVEMDFSYITDTDLFPEELYDPTKQSTSNSIMTNLVQRTFGGHDPFLFQFDSATATSDDSFMWCRLNSDFQATQVANQIWNMNLSLRETW